MKKEKFENYMVEKRRLDPKTANIYSMSMYDLDKCEKDIDESFGSFFDMNDFDAVFDRFAMLLDHKKIKERNQTSNNFYSAIMTNFLNFIAALNDEDYSPKRSYLSKLTKRNAELKIASGRDMDFYTNAFKYDGSSLQVIYFGAPGCGKSFSVKKELNDHIIESERTTFHPDSDYATFVGCYKPKMNKAEKRIEYSFVAQAFGRAYVEAWRKFFNGEKYALVIEEINRGNCAQIFGDIFQLLDRGKDGYSEYPITVDADFEDYIKEELSPKQEGDTDYYSYYTNIIELHKKEGYERGNVLLPPNFYIYATMNTSDQSLFPMDSAFKRRWEMRLRTGTSFLLTRKKASTNICGRTSL